MARIKNKFLHDIKPFVDKNYGSYRYTLIMHYAYRRFSNLVADNNDEPRALSKHTKTRIYPAIAIMDSLLKNGIPWEEALDFVENYYMWRCEVAANKIRTFLKIPFMYRLVPRLFKGFVRKSFGEKAGFKCAYNCTKRKRIQFDVLSCPYYDICAEYGYPDLTRIFCMADDICYGDMHPKLQWNRCQTIADGGDLCDFDIKISS